MTVMLDDTLFLKLGDAKHLERDKALQKLVSILKSDAASDPATISLLEQGIKTLLASDVWEQRLGGLLGAKVTVPTHASSEFCEHVQLECMRLLEDSEVRVRLAVGEALHVLAARTGVAVYEACGHTVLTSIYEHFDRDQVDDSQAAGSGRVSPNPGRGPISGGSGMSSPGAGRAGPAPGDLIGALLHSTYKPRIPGIGEMRHGTEGWKCLETSMKAFQHLVEGVGEAIKPHLTLPVRQLMYKALHHPNRFVRETGHFTMCTVCCALQGPELQSISLEVATRIADGLSDNWSQVRYAACVSARSFLQWLGPDAIEPLLPSLLGPLCLNRYYVAEGVRLYAQETWRLVMGQAGRQAVARHTSQVVAYYISQSKANNHAVREAACACIAELMEKVDREAVAPHVPLLVKALIICFKDMSWPVRDAACTACGRCVLAYPNEMRPQMDEMFGLWLAHLADNIPTVRENSAVALGKAVRAYGPEALERVLPALHALLPMARQQAPESGKYTGLQNTTQFGVAARKARDNDPAVHSDQEMFSCGSLVARFTSSYLVRSDGCMDHGFSRDKEPWEMSDGAVFLLRELAVAQPAQVTPELLQLLADLPAISSFQHAFNLHESVWRVLPKIAVSIGKQKFKPHLELFLGPMFADLSCGHQLAEVAAGRCIAAMRDLLGPGIFAGRLSDEQRAALASNVNVPSPLVPPPRPEGATATAGTGLFSGLSGLPSQLTV